MTLASLEVNLGNCDVPTSQSAKELSATMPLVLANVFGVISGTLIMLFSGVTLQATLPDGVPFKGVLLVPFALGWVVALLVTKPRSSTTAEVLDQGLLLGAIEWGLAFPVAFVAVLTQTWELEHVSSAGLVGYVLGGLMIGGGVTLLGVGLFVSFRYVARRVVSRTQHSETQAGAG